MTPSLGFNRPLATQTLFPVSFPSLPVAARSPLGSVRLDTTRSQLIRLNRGKRIEQEGDLFPPSRRGELYPLLLREGTKQELDLSRASSSDAVCGKDIALVINGLAFLSIAMPPRKSRDQRRAAHLSPTRHQASNDITVYVPSMGPWRTVTQGKQYQTLLPTMMGSMDTLHARTYGLSYPLRYGRNDGEQTCLCAVRAWMPTDITCTTKKFATPPSQVGHYKQELRFASASNNLLGNPRAKSKEQRIQAS
ncbi:hypothetical protein ACLOJK_019074 [Asimina triloba]